MAVGFSGSNGGISCLPKKIGKRGKAMIDFFSSLRKQC